MKKADLQAFRLLTLELQNRAERLKVLRAAAERSTALIPKTRVQSSRSTSTLEDFAIRLVEEEAQYKRLLEEWCDRRLQALTEICARIADPLTLQILTARYIEAKRWTTIESELSYSKQTLYRRHRAGLRAFDR